MSKLRKKIDPPSLRGKRGASEGRPTSTARQTAGRPTSTARQTAGRPTSTARQTAGRQVSIFDLLKDLSDKNRPTEGQYKIIDRLRASIRMSIKGSPLSRHQIAGEMSHLLGETITKEMIDSWTREDQQIPPDPPLGKGGDSGRSEKWGRIVRHVPAEYLPALCWVTRDNGPMTVMGEAAGVFVLPGPEALRAEIQKLDEEILDAKARKRKRLVFLREMEGAGMRR